MANNHGLPHRVGVLWGAWASIFKYYNDIIRINRSMKLSISHFEDAIWTVASAPVHWLGRLCEWNASQCAQCNKPVSSLVTTYGTFSLDVRSASDGTLETDVRPPRNGVKRPCPIGLGRSLGRPTVCLLETKWVRRPTHQPIKWSSKEYLAMFNRFRSHTKIIGKGNLFDFATIFTQLTAWSCTRQSGNLK